MNQIKIKALASRLGLLALLALWLSYAVQARERREEVEISKRVEVSLATETDVKVELTNKYGRIEVRTWARDSVWMQAEITASGKDREQAEKVLSRVDVRYQESRRYFMAQTEYQKGDSRPALISSFMNMLSDTRSALIDQSNVKVDYTLYVPEKARLDIENKFGDVLLGNFDGDLRLDLSHGNLRADALTGEDVRLSLSFGEGQVRELRAPRLNAKFAKLFFDKASTLSWRGVSSELQLVEAQRIELSDSRKDAIEVEFLQSLEGSAQFSRLEVGELSHHMNLSTEFGSLTVGKLKTGFSGVELNTQSTDISLRLERTCAYHLDLEAPDDRLSYPDIWQQFLSDSDPLTENKTLDKKRIIRGTIGEKPSGRFLLRSQGGHIHIQD